jgi:cytochrome P450
MTTEASLERGLAAPSFIDDPYETYRALQELAPLHWSDTWNAWVLTRYDDVVAVLRDSQRFSNAGRFSLLLDQLPDDAQEAAMPLRRHYASGILQCDPPDHPRIRGLVRQAFTPRAVERVRQRVVEMVDQLLDAVPADASFDVIADLAKPLPAMVISEMLGVPPEDRDQFIPLGDDLTALQSKGRGVRENAQIAATAVQTLESYFRDLYAERRRRPREDLISALVEAREGGDRLTENELVNTCVTMLVAGHETTRNLIGNATMTLLRHPEQLARLRAEPDLLQSTIEECLRFESPIQRGWRRVAEDTELLGTQLRRDQLLFLMFGAANRDHRQFPDPDRFDIARTDNRHIAFGYGIHFCLGAPLARLEAPIAVNRIIDRFPKLELAGEAKRVDSIHLRGFTNLPLKMNVGA